MLSGIGSHKECLSQFQRKPQSRLCKPEKVIVSEGIQVAVPEPIEQVVPQVVDRVITEPIEEVVSALAEEDCSPSTRWRGDTNAYFGDLLSLLNLLQGH